MKLDYKDFVYVIIQGILFVCYLLNPKVINFDCASLLYMLGLLLLGIGMVIIVYALFQLRESLSPFPSPRADAKFIQTGLYKFIRHPIYTGILCVVFGYAVFTCSSFKVIISFSIYILFHFKAKYEEKKLTIFFSEYADYQKTTGRFLPKISTFLAEK
ncbi:hypothetical protein GCM10009430_16940 [Aquimarina litoralis]|uniref:Isoprenylcysteine carboxylmethyltransferase family protein n=1 Tax=Aquimarina litoralis TaxID=584605 RepID=A0ABN1IPA6_9FLAO